MVKSTSGEEWGATEPITLKPDLEIIETEKPDLEVFPDAEPVDELEIGSGLTLRFDPQYSEETYEELEVLRQTEQGSTTRQRLAEWFGPEMTAGVVIGLLVAIFAVLMVVGVREQPTQEIETPASAPVAPPAEDIPSVEIGEAITLERE